MVNDRINFNGHIKIYKNDQLVVDKDNLVVTSGRHWLMQKIGAMPYIAGEDSKEGWNIQWFSVGSGAGTIDTHVQPISPTDDDTDLYNVLEFNATPTTFMDTTGTRKLIDSMQYDSYLLAKCIMTVDYDDAVDTYINEAGLYVSPTNLPSETNFTMLSHVSFPTITKSQFDKINIEWYFMF